MNPLEQCWGMETGVTGGALERYLSIGEFLEHPVEGDCVINCDVFQFLRQPLPSIRNWDHRKAANTLVHSFKLGLGIALPKPNFLINMMPFSSACATDAHFGIMRQNFPQ